MADSKSSEHHAPEPTRGDEAVRASDESAAAANSEKPALTPEEQMALYEESLKETDWGHQPC